MWRGALCALVLGGNQLVEQQLFAVPFVEPLRTVVFLSREAFGGQIEGRFLHVVTKAVTRDVPHAMNAFVGDDRHEVPSERRVLWWNCPHDVIVGSSLEFLRGLVLHPNAIREVSGILRVQGEQANRTRKSLLGLQAEVSRV